MKLDDFGKGRALSVHATYWQGKLSLFTGKILPASKLPSGIVQHQEPWLHAAISDITFSETFNNGSMKHECYALQIVTYVWDTREVVEVKTFIDKDAQRIEYQLSSLRSNAKIDNGEPIRGYNCQDFIKAFRTESTKRLKEYNKSYTDACKALARKYNISADDAGSLVYYAKKYSDNEDAFSKEIAQYNVDVTAKEVLSEYQSLHKFDKSYVSPREVAKACYK